VQLCKNCLAVLRQAPVFLLLTLDGCPGLTAVGDPASCVLGDPTGCVFGILHWGRGVQIWVCQSVFVSWCLCSPDAFARPAATLVDCLLSCEILLASKATTEWAEM
jgi:hypothetical protein